MKSCRSLVIGCWPLVIGHWSLVIGYWSLVSSNYGHSALVTECICASSAFPLALLGPLCQGGSNYIPNLSKTKLMWTSHALSYSEFCVTEKLKHPWNSVPHCEAPQ